MEKQMLILGHFKPAGVRGRPSLCSSGASLMQKALRSPPCICAGVRLSGYLRACPLEGLATQQGRSGETVEC